MRSTKIRSKKKKRKTYNNRRTYNHYRTKKIGKRNKKTKKIKKKIKKTYKNVQRGGLPKKCLYCNNLYYTSEEARVRGAGWYSGSGYTASGISGEGSPSNIICPTCYGEIKSKNMYNPKSQWMLIEEGGKKMYVNKTTGEKRTEVPEEGSDIDISSFQRGSVNSMGGTMEENVQEEMSGWSGETRGEKLMRLEREREIAKKEKAARKQEAVEKWKRLPQGHNLGTRKVWFE